MEQQVAYMNMYALMSYELVKFLTDEEMKETFYIFGLRTMHQLIQ
jgi:hypothetical protein